MKKVLMVLGLLVLPTLCFARDSNPDGLLNRPSFTLLAGFNRANRDFSLGYSHNYRYHSRLEDYNFRAEIIYPATRSLSLILRAKHSISNEYSPVVIWLYVRGIGF